MNILSAVIMLLMFLIHGCGSPPEQVSNRHQGAVLETTNRSEPLEIRCNAEQEPDGRTVVRYEARNIGQNPVYVPEDRRMPYELVRGDVLVVFQGVNAPELDRIYEIYSLPKVKAVLPGETFRGETELGKSMLRDHFHQALAPAKFLHGRIRVACAVGWGETPIADPGHTRFDDFMAWQHITNVAPFDVVLP